MLCVGIDTACNVLYWRDATFLFSCVQVPADRKGSE